MVRIYGHSWPVRWGDRGERKMVKVYSNCPEVELFVNGRSAGAQEAGQPGLPGRRAALAGAACARARTSCARSATTAASR